MMKLRPEIDRILELGEEIYRHYFRCYNQTSNGRPLATPAPELAQLKAHLTSLSPDTLYLCITALEVGRGVLHPQSFFPAFMAVAGAFPRHLEAVNRLLKDPEHLANNLEGGLLRLYEAGLKIDRLFSVSNLWAA
jgi:hypothetical protein